MVWLIGQMWATLAIAAALGLLFGWSIRGLLLVGKARRAAVERDVARTELDQARVEIEGLYRAQRLASTQVAVAPERKDADPAADRNVAALSAALAAAKDEISRLSAERSAPRAETPPRLDANLSKDAAVLSWRNRYLESRNRVLEERLSAATAPQPQPQPQPQPVPAVERPEAPTADPEAVKRAEQELARLRWRNRYLEGRLAYLEAPEPQESAGDDRKPQARAASGEIGSAGGEAGLALRREPERPAEAILSFLSEADAASEPQRPPSLSHPRGGVGDDLTAINGIGPKLQDLLNAAGVHHFDQIASWNAANVAWMNEHLSFAGRIERERWVEQADILAGSRDPGEADVH